MSTKEKDLERYNVARATGEKYVGQQAFDLLAKETFAAIHTKSNEGHIHALKDLTADATHRLVTDAEKAEWNRKAQVHELEKTDLAQADTVLLATVKTPKDRDIAVIKTTVDEKDYEYSAYIYLTDKWVALNGMVDADKVILRNDITLAGNYTQVGNLTKGQTATAKFAVKGKSVAAALLEILSKREQPRITANPAVSGFTLSGAKAVEVGTKITTAQFSGAKLSTGSYTYGPDTGIVAQSYKVDRVCDPAGLSKDNVAQAATGEDNNNATGFIIGDDTSYASNVVKSLKYKVTVNHNEGAQAVDNLGSPSNPPIKIQAGAKSQETAAYTGFRKYFYGTTTDKVALTSDIVRGLTNSTGAYRAQTLTVQVPAGAARVIVACIGTAKGVTKVINKSALNADVTSTFVKSTLAVEGAGGYKAVDYNVWVFVPASPFEKAATLEVTLG